MQRDRKLLDDRMAVTFAFVWKLSSSFAVHFQACLRIAFSLWEKVSALLSLARAFGDGVQVRFDAHSVHGRLSLNP